MGIKGSALHLISSLSHNTSVQISESNFFKNSASFGGAVFISGVKEVVISGTHFIQNKAVDFMTENSSNYGIAGAFALVGTRIIKLR